MSTDSRNETEVPRLVDGRPVRELVVPVAEDGHFDRVVPLVTRLAARWRVPIRLVHVTPSICSSDPELETAAETLRDWYPEVTFGTAHLAGDVPAAAIADTAGAGSLVVMSTDHIDRWRCDASTAEDVVERLRSPVVVVGPRVTNAALRADDEATSAGGEVIVCLDGSSAAEEGLAPAVELAAGLGRPLRLVVAVEAVGGVDKPDPRPLPGHYLDALGARCGGLVETSWEVIVGNDPIAAVELLAQRRRASFLVATTTGRKAPDRRTMASVSSGLAETAARPVLIVTARRGQAIEPVPSWLLATETDFSRRAISPAQATISSHSR